MVAEEEVTNMVAEEVTQTMVSEEEEVTNMVAEEVTQTLMVAEEEEEVVDWSDVPYHIVELIMNKLMTPAPLAPKKIKKLRTPTEIFDYVRCGAVCTSWRTVFIHHHHHPPTGTSSVTLPLPLPPFLIVPTPSSSSSTSTKKNKKKKKKKTARNNYFNKKNKNKKKKKVRRTNTNKSLSFYNIIDKKIYNQFQVTIPGNRHFRGSSHGWLVAVDQNYNNCQILLFNPYNKCEILLPSLKHLHVVLEENPLCHNPNYDYCLHTSHTSYTYLKKAILSADPLSNPIDYMVMAILGLPGRLAYCRPGDGSCPNKAWTLVEIEYPQEWGCRDVIYYKGKFIALYYPGTVVVLDPTKNMIPVILKTPRPRSHRLQPPDTMYLVESAGRLLQVYRELEVGDEDIVTGRKPYSTTRFKVFKLWDETKKMNYDILKVNQEQKEGEYGLGLRWMLLKCISGQTLFLGDNHSMWIRASDFPGCKPNSIYFTDDFIESYYSEPEEGPHDLGIFNLVDCTIENHYLVDHKTPIWPIPIWVQPIVLAGSEFGGG